jgi:DNA-binding response OmpR family regulator
MRESVVALDNGNERLASQLALSAYLDGFEPVEPVRRLRAKIDDGFEPKLIRTVRGMGYVLEEQECE